MRLQGTFLSSVVSRRLFWSLLAAAVLPLMLFGMLGYQALDARLEAQTRRTDTALMKYVGMRTFDRLVLARAALAAHARDADWERPAAPAAELREKLQAVATADTQGGLRGGDAGVVDAWRRASAQATATATDRRALWWAPAGPGQAAAVIVGVPDPGGRGWWLATLAPGFLWYDFATEAVGADLCVSDPDGRELRCPAGSTLGSTAGPGLRTWALFLDVGFGSPDWQLALTSRETLQLGESAIGSWAVQAGAATLLLIAVLSLTQVRRVMVPLERLSAATRRLAGGEWSTRVELPTKDEFGQLAGSLNAMAERIENQIQRLEVNAAIDRSILDGVDVADVMRRVAGRLEATTPGARVAIAARDADGTHWRSFRADGSVTGLVTPDAQSRRRPVEGLAVHGDPGRAVPDWALQALGLAAAERWAICWVPVLWQDELTALLLLAGPQPFAMGPEQQREVGDLRDRVAVTLAAATREFGLVERAMRDSLTGLLNRHGLHEEAAAWLAGGAEPRACALMFIDLDGFKEINDVHGHRSGDELLVAVAARLRELVPAAALLSRPGGDEFVVLLPGEPAAAEALADRICDRLAQPFAMQAQCVHVGASVGIASCPEDGTDLVELMRRADMAMYAAKGAGRGVWRRYCLALDEQASERAWIVRDLRLALEGGDQLSLHFQPRVDARTGAVHSAEALVRWQHPVRGAIAPFRFIGVAEDAGLIEPLGRQVLLLALQQLRRWRDDELAVDRVAINVSAHQLRDDHFTQLVLQQLERHGLVPEDLELEITESLFVHDIDAVCARLAPLRERGVLIALDDFGTGYSSLSALHRLPVDVLKIDRSFVSELGQRASADAVVRSVLLLARALGKRVVAEGVETAQQKDLLTELGCDEFQGYLYARPLPAPEFAERLRVGFGAQEAQLA